jgi:hypothetical protein
MSAMRPRSLSCPPTSATPPTTPGLPPTSARIFTRRTWLGCVLLGAQVVALAACGGDDEDDAQQPRAAPEAPQASVPKLAREPVTLTLGAMLVEFAPVVGKAIEQWNRGELPGASEGIQLQRITIRISPPREPLGTIEHVQAKVRGFLTEQESAGTPVDLLMVNRLFDFPWAFRSGIIQPLDPYLQQDRNEPLAKFMPSALELVRYQGRSMALPVAMNAGVTRYNPKHFDDAGLSVPDNGWTREEFIAAAQQLTEDTDNDGKVDAWGFRPQRSFVNWLPFALQEMDRDVIDLDTGAVRLTGPAALRGLQFWEELGRVHGILPHGTEVTADHFSVSFWIRHPGVFFYYFLSPGSVNLGKQAPLPSGPRDLTPLTLGAALAIPANARDAAQSYEALAPLALYIGEHLLLPPVISGQKYIEKPASGYIELMLPEYDRQLALHLLDTARPSPLASSSVMTIQLFEKLTLPLARGEMGLMQAAQQAQNWLESYLNE